VQSPVLAAAIDQVDGILGTIPAETYRMHDNNIGSLASRLAESHADHFLITAVIRIQHVLTCNALLDC
jgi:hypothetical protein